MKKIKGLLSIAITIIMVLCLCSFSVSADGYKITVNGGTAPYASINGHEFAAYKVLSVTASGDNYMYTLDNTCLSQGGYGTGYTTADEITATITDETSARTFAEYVYEYYIKNSSPTAKGTATASDNTAEIPVDSAGYYIVVDTTNSGVSKAFVMLDTAAPTVEINAKLYNKPTITKQIQEDSDNSWGVVADHQIGDTVHFRIITSVPDVDGISDYKYIIHDTLDAGFTFNNDVQIYIDDTDTELAASYYTVSGTDITVKIYDALKNNVITTTNQLYIKYSATLNENAKVVQSAVSMDSSRPFSNQNKATLEFSANTESGKDTSESNIVYDWTYYAQIRKVDMANQPINDETEFEVYAGGTKLYFIDNQDNTYTVTSNGTSGAVTTIKTDSSQGLLKIFGLDNQTDYKILETKAPDGYKLPAEADSAVYKLNVEYFTDGSYITTFNGTVSGKVVTDNSPATCTGYIEIRNESGGAKLVGTGGIGTTVFYVFGGILMAGAGVLLITKLRFENKEN